MFGELSDHLGGAVKRLTGRGRITEENIEETLRELRIALLEADVALPVVKRFLAAVKERALGAEIARSLTPGQAFTKIVHDELAALFTTGTNELNLRVRPPAVLLLAGLQGAGKTTTAAKLAARLKRDKKRVLLVSTDVARPAAIEQLETLAGEVGVGFIPAEGDQPVAIAKRALKRAQAELVDVLIVDTAGRLHVDDVLMGEAKQLADVLKPVETLFVADAMTGQDAVRSAAAFGEALPLTGVILSKADGDARGGAALSVAEVIGRPIKFIGVGEKMDALEVFDPKRMAGRILGKGDIVGLAEEAAEKTDKGEAEKLARKLRKGKGFDLDDFRAQIEQMFKMGGAQALLDKLPGAGKMRAAAAAGLDDKMLRRQVAIIQSMTPRERHFPAVIDGSRRRRIAAGSGTEVREVNQLLRQFQQARKMMKRFKKKGGMERAMGALGGGLPRGF
ncbi:MAG: signal recognition particle protein [Gammaproteobacteria bacterium]|nr:signal recognition particle protein [Gammaproteobacteria bacterium]